MGAGDRAARFAACANLSDSKGGLTSPQHNTGRYRRHSGGRAVLKGLRGKVLRSAAAAGAALLSFAFAEPSAAASRLCRQLEAELVGGGGGGNTAQFKKYDRAVDAQREQLSLARSRARRAGCGFTLLTRGSELCAPLNGQIERMQSNLAALERKRDQLGGGAKPKRSRATVLAALDANGCRGETIAQNGRRKPKTTEEDGGDFFSRLFGGGVRRSETPEAREAAEAAERRRLVLLQARERGTNVTRILNPNGETTVFGPPGEFSTMCVRTCDGYFFPISPNSSSGDFERDQKNCETTCPGTQVQLYYRPAGDEATETMMSVAGGEAYSSLPTAYLYRDVTKPRPAACGCAATAENPNFSVIGGASPAEAAPAEPVTPAPTARPDPGADPETLANGEGKLDIATIKRILKPKATSPVQATGERKVRVVGPVFLPDPEGAIDLKAPGQKKVQ